MPVVYLYIRVSTDEQAVKGYSQRSQLERLVHYCKYNSLVITETILEDCSAKTFNRPAWNKLITKIKYLKNSPATILFTCWDRFSRNITDAYIIFEKLQKLGVSLQAIDQPIDFSIPESKIILAVYLATSEVENDKKSRNVSLGLQKARLEGRWINKAPLGYRNKITADGKKYIAAYAPEAFIIREVFEEIIKAKRVTLSEIYKEAMAKGLKCSRSAFYMLVRNPIYCGQIKIPEMGNEKSRIIDGLHRGIVSVELFERVQKVLGNIKNSRLVKKKRVLNENYLLRGILLCPDCGKTLTGSSSQGRSRKYYYYHCTGKCKYRIRADYINAGFELFLKDIKIDVSFSKRANDLMKKIDKGRQQDYQIKKHEIGKAMDKSIDRSLNAHKLFSEGKIDYDDYFLIKENCKAYLKKYASELRELALKAGAGIYLKNAEDNIFCRLAEVYELSDVLMKQRIARLFFTEKVIVHENILNILPEYIKEIFGMKLIKNNSKNEKDLTDDELINHFFSEIALIAFEQELKTI
ncbi:recombinase family protein [Flavobacterium notoginsengisoli]|uniref:recombinase family protein n=1 Tax=Flavobacterium notoginsengisoli TaxID=1478199 RepID=UPI00363F63EF